MALARRGNLNPGPTQSTDSGLRPLAAALARGRRRRAAASLSASESLETVTVPGGPRSRSDRDGDSPGRSEAPAVTFSDSVTTNSVCQGHGPSGFESWQSASQSDKLAVSSVVCAAAFRVLRTLKLRLTSGSLRLVES